MPEIAEWSLPAVLDTVTDTVPDRDMLVSGPTAGHIDTYKTVPGGSARASSSTVSACSGNARTSTGGNAARAG